MSSRWHVRAVRVRDALKSQSNEATESPSEEQTELGPKGRRPVARGPLLPPVRPPERVLRLRSWIAEHVWLPLSIIVLAAALLSLRWVFLVPIYQAPDEPTHLDYAFTIFNSGHLISGRDTSVARGGHSYTSPYSRYLLAVSEEAAIAFRPPVHVPSGYGTEAYYANVDRGAPKIPGDWRPIYTPVLLSLYPFGYYGLVALWLGLIHVFTPSLVALFFGARILSVLLLMCSLVLTYLITRELRMQRGAGLLVTAIVGLFPLTTFVSSYVQPDNLSLTLVSLCMYAAFVARRQPDSRVVLGVLGIALGLLLVTKYQFYACTLIPVAAMLVAERLFGRPIRLSWTRLFVFLVPPSLVLGLVQLWVAWQARTRYSAAIGSNAVVGQVNYAAAHAALHRGLGPFMGFLFTGFSNAFADYFNGGTSFISFIGFFGWLDTPLVIGSPQIDPYVKHLAIGVTLLVFALTTIRLGQVLARLGRLVSRSRWRTALRLALANPLFNGLFLYVVFMFVLYAVTSNTFGAQGRNWFPYILPIFLMGVVYAPRAIPYRPAQVVLSRLVLLALVLYASFGSYYGVQAITNRYYDSGTPMSPTILSRLKPTFGTSNGRMDTVSVDDATSVLSSPGEQTIEASTAQVLTIAGWAVDLKARDTAAGVFITVDASHNFPAFYFDDRPDVANALGSKRYEHSGFVAVIPSHALAPGRHVLSLKIVSHSRTEYDETSPQIALIER